MALLERCCAAGPTDMSYPDISAGSTRIRTCTHTRRLLPSRAYPGLALVSSSSPSGSRLLALAAIGSSLLLGTSPSGTTTTTTGYCSRRERGGHTQRLRRRARATAAARRGSGSGAMCCSARFRWTWTAIKSTWSLGPPFSTRESMWMGCSFSLVSCLLSFVSCLSWLLPHLPESKLNRDLPDAA